MIALMTPRNTLAAPVSDGYYFDTDLLKGERISGVILERLSHDRGLPPGRYMLDVSVNARFVTKTEVRMIVTPQGSTLPCLNPALLRKVGFEDTNSAAVDQCSASGVVAQLDADRLRLNLEIPQSRLHKRPRGFVDPDDLNAGMTAGFVNYLTNYYHVSYRGDDRGDQNAAFMAINGGFNLGAWQLRQQSNWSWDAVGGSHYNVLRSYLQRPLPTLDSQLVMGQTTTTGRLFSGLNYTGLGLSSDERMLPDSRRGYAPTVRGTARSNAKVSIRQNGQVIHQVTVPPGPFEINDLYPTRYSGDLDVEIVEADGSVTRFSVPYSAVPESLREGTWHYDIAFGRTRDLDNDALFGDAGLQYGLSNAVTLNSGLRIAEGYRAITLGGVYSSAFGALGLDSTYSSAQLGKTGSSNGWMVRASYSDTFANTDTSLYLAAYRYSTAGYRDLADALNVRDAERDGHQWQSATYQQVARFEATLSQRLGAYGTVFLSGSTQRYRAGRTRDTQVQAGYGTTLANGLSFNLSVARQRLGAYDVTTQAGHGGYGPDSPSLDTSGPDSLGRTETVTSLSLSLPLGAESSRSTSLSATFIHSSTEGAQYQTDVSGFADASNTLSYTTGLSHDERRRQSVWHGNLQKRLPSANVGIAASADDTYWQASANAQGALVAHAGGITLGPYLGDTFALVEARGAEGAHLMNGQGTVIDSNGYALVPALAPYRYANVALNPDGMSSDAELLDAEQRVAPYAGAAVKVVFRTRNGRVLLIRAQRKDGAAIPVGADALDERGQVVGMVGQAGLVYLRTEQRRGMLRLQWGDAENERCSLHYQLNDEAPQVISRLRAPCT